MNEIFKVLGEENRYRIFTYLLKNGESCVCDLEKLLDIKQANLSKHLMILRKENIVLSKQVGKFVHYKIDDEFVREHFELINYIDKREPDCQIVNCNC